MLWTLKVMQHCTCVNSKDNTRLLNNLLLAVISVLFEHGSRVEESTAYKTLFLPHFSLVCVRCFSLLRNAGKPLAFCNLPHGDVGTIGQEFGYHREDGILPVTCTRQAALYPMLMAFGMCES